MSQIKITRDNMAYFYAGFLVMEPFNRLNRIIIDRWSLSGLKYIKERAWKILEELKGFENNG